jgi:hypothetical protein
VEFLTTISCIIQQNNEINKQKKSSHESKNNQLSFSAQAIIKFGQEVKKKEKKRVDLFLPTCVKNWPTFPTWSLF